MGYVSDPRSANDGEMEESKFILPKSAPIRWLIGFITISLPIVSFAITDSGFPDPAWQMGLFSDYAEIMLGGQVSAYFYPFLIYSMLCMFLLLISEDRYARYFAIRLGIYTGVILALQYSILLASTSFAEFSGYSLVIWIILSSPWWNQRLIKWLQARGLLSYARIGVFVLGGWKIFYESGGKFIDASLWILVISILSIGPFVCLIIAVQVAWRLLTEYEPINSWGRTKSVSMIIWGVPYIAAWRLAVLRTLEIYSELPVMVPSDCYIATAAARGNPSLVKSTPVRMHSGEVLFANPQLRYLKCAELALRAVTPRVHRQCRRIYDHYGMKLAGKITTPRRAAMAYYSLKPLEWASRVILHSLLPRFDELAGRLYTQVSLKTD